MKEKHKTDLKIVGFFRYWCHSSRIIPLFKWVGGYYKRGELNPETFYCHSEQS